MSRDGEGRMMQSVSSGLAWYDSCRHRLVSLITHQTLIIMAFLVLCSALCEVVIKHHSRQHFMQLQSLLKQKVTLLRQREHLLMARSHLLAQHHLSQSSKEQLHMRLPLPHQIQRVR